MYTCAITHKLSLFRPRGTLDLKKLINGLVQHQLHFYLLEFYEIYELL